MAVAVAPAGNGAGGLRHIHFSKLPISGHETLVTQHEARNDGDNRHMDLVA